MGQFLGGDADPEPKVSTLSELMWLETASVIVTYQQETNQYQVHIKPV